MKVKQFLVMSLFGAALAACSSNDEIDKVVDNGNNEGALVSLTLDFAKSNARAVGDAIAATEPEKKVSKLTIVAVNGSGNVAKSVTNVGQATTGDLAYQDGKYTFTIEPGTYTLYAFANCNNTFSGTFTNAEATVASSGSYTGFYTANNFLMGSVDATGTEVAAIADATTETKLVIERAAVKTTASLKFGYTIEDTYAEPGQITADGVAFGLSHVATTTKIMEDATYQPTAYETAAPTLTTSVVPRNSDEATDKSDPVYALENHYKGTDGTEITFAVFKATYLPKAVAFVDTTDPEATALKTEDRDFQTTPPASSFYVITGGKEVGRYLLHEKFTTADEKKDFEGKYNITLSSSCYEGGVCYLKTKIKNDDPTICRNYWYNLNVSKLTFPGESTPPTKWEEPKDAQIVATVEVADWIDGGDNEVTVE